MKIAINAQQLAATHTLPDIIDLVGTYGVSAVELWPANLPGSSEDPEAQERYETKDVRWAQELLSARGIEVACVTLGFHAAPLCTASGGAQNLARALMGAVDAAVTLRCQLVNCYTAFSSEYVFLEAVRLAAPYAAERRVVITLENEAHDVSGVPENVARMVAEIDSPAFRTQYDPCNYYHARVEAFPHAYHVLRGAVGYVHFKGGCLYTPREGLHLGSEMRDSTLEHIGYLPLEESAFPVEAVVRSLKADGYSGWVTLEPHVPVAALAEVYARDVPYLRRLLEQP